MTNCKTLRDVQYLYLVGRLYPDNRLELLPTFLTIDPQNVMEDPESPLTAELYDAYEKLLLRFRIPIGTYCAPGETIPELPVRGKIPFPVTTNQIRFYREGVLIHEIQISATAPEVRLTWKPSQIVSGKKTISWISTHPEGRAIKCFLRYSNTDGAIWQPASFPTESNRHEIDFDRFPGGVDCRIMVVATDGVRTTTIESKSFRVPIKQCQPMILAPLDGSSFAVGQSVLLQGQGYYIEEQLAETENLLWISSQDGELGRGSLVEVHTLSPGIHRITLRVGTRERTKEASVSIGIDGTIDQQWVLSPQSKR